jgi:ribosomal protein L11 methyltransferase
VADCWFEVTVEVLQEHGDAVANFLMDHDAPGLQCEERAGRTLLTACFRDQPPVESLRRFCADIGCPPPTPRIGVREIADENWAENWKLHFQPQRVGDHLYVCAPWETAVPPGRIPIVIDPGMAFGTGQHASTRGCLALIERATAAHRIGRALDVGTGSGVLAIALAKLGVAEVWAADKDANARAVAAANFGCNHVARSIHLVSTLEEAHGTFDLVVANLFANLLQELAPQLRRKVRPDTPLICSGFFGEDERRVCRTYEALGLDVRHRYEEDSWVTVTLRARISP